MKKKSLNVLSALCLSATVLAGCSSNEETKPLKIGVAQIVSHTSLNTIRDSFVSQMEELGYKDGETVEYDFADAAGQPSNLNAIMSQFADEESDAIVAIATPTAQAAANYAEEIPVVFSAVSDPVGAGLVQSLDKPGGNITGTSDEVQIDQIIALAKQVNPDLKTLGFLYNAGEANSVSNLKKAKEYCSANGIELIEGTGKDMTELQSSASVLAEKVDAMFSPNDNTVASGMAALSKIALDAKIPYYVGADSMVQDGGFATVGINYEELGRETANMVDEILKGEKAGDIPVKVFKDGLNIYVNKAYMDQLNITLPDEIKDDDNLIMIGE
ncbi:hypothetical protein C815_00259 [Firmicutes bacterium M10-2]|nr:hypothetical protein C815_00259 [Firmicutes bacterium M10-2]